MRRVALLAVLAPALASAQTRTLPRTSVLLSVGAGEAPNDATTGEAGGAVLAALGLRYRAWRALIVEGAVQTSWGYATGADAVLHCLPSGGPGAPCRVREYDRRDQMVDLLPSAVARAGIEGVLGTCRVRGRLTVGAGRMFNVGETFGSAAAGLSIGGRRVRFALEAEQWRYRLDAAEYAERVPRPTEGDLFRLDRRLRLPARSTFVRVGVELPIGR